MKAIRVIKYTDTYKNQWNLFNKSSVNGTFLFDRDFMEYHSDRFIDHSLLVFNENELVAIFPANQINNTIYSHQGLTYGGLIVKSNLYSNLNFLAFQLILKYYNAIGFTEILVKTIPYIFYQQPSSNLDYLAFICQAKLVRCDIHSAINLHNEYVVSKSVVRDVKQTVSKNNLIVKKSDDINLFWENLLIPNLQEVHQSKPVHTLTEIKLLQQNFPDSIVFFGCYKDEFLIGGILVFETQYVAHSQYISGTKEFNKLSGLTVLIHEVLKYYKNKKAFFNLGISHQNAGLQISSGLLTWKEKFGARSVSQPFYSFKTSSFNKIDDIFI